MPVNQILSRVAICAYAMNTLLGKCNTLYAPDNQPNVYWQMAIKNPSLAQLSHKQVTGPPLGTQRQSTVHRATDIFLYLPTSLLLTII